jgi:hypothetical protein
VFKQTLLCTVNFFMRKGLRMRLNSYLRKACSKRGNCETVRFQIHEANILSSRGRGGGGVLSVRFYITLSILQIDHIIFK